VDDLPAAFPELQEAIAHLCEGWSWRFTGASVLPLDGTHLYLEITKPKHWRRDAGASATSGAETIAGIGAIGGSLEPGEGVLACLRREVAEEIGAPVAVQSAAQTHLVYEERTIETLALPSRDVPAPVLCTVSRNLYRRAALPDAQVLAIATYWAALEGRPQLCDLFGLLAVPLGALPQVLAAADPGQDVGKGLLAVGRHPTVAGVRGLQGVRLETRRPMDENTLLAPVWTARSLQILLRAGRLRLPPSGCALPH